MLALWLATGLIAKAQGTPPDPVLPSHRGAIGFRQEQRNTRQIERDDAAIMAVITEFLRIEA